MAFLDVVWSNGDLVTEAKMDQMVENEKFIPKLFMSSDPFGWFLDYRPATPVTALSKIINQGGGSDVGSWTEFAAARIKWSLYHFTFKKLYTGISNVRMRCTIWADDTGVDFFCKIGHYNPSTSSSLATNLYSVINKNVASASVYELWDTTNQSITGVSVGNMIVIEVGVWDAQAASSPATTQTLSRMLAFNVEIS